MLFGLTTAGRALLDATPTEVVITRADFGDSFNYSLPQDPISLDGDLVYSTDVVWYPVVVGPNTIKYSLYLGADVDSFSFGEVALYSDSTLFGIGVNAILKTKVGPSNGNPGQALGLDFFIDLTAGQTYSETNIRAESAFPRLSVPDLLVPPAQNQNNAYVIYGLTDTDVPYLAFADPTGKWGFSSKPRAYLTGTVNSVGAYGLQTLDLTGTYAGAVTDLILQFVSGTKRGYCRTISTQVAEGFTWTIPLAELPDVGDSFILVGPNDPSIPGPTGPTSIPTWNYQTSSCNVSLGDAENIVVMDSTDPTTVTFLDDSSVDIPIGSAVIVASDNTGIVTLVAGSRVVMLVRSGLPLTLTGQYSMATVVKRAANTWYATGDLG